MKKLLTFLSLFLVSLAGGCVTINIYFPAEEIKSAADQIVDEVWGDRPAQPESAQSRSLLLDLLVQPAMAEQNINIDTPEIRAIKAALKHRSEQVKSLLAKGAIGIGNDGYLKARDAGGDLKLQAEANKVLGAENADRRRLYQEIAKANGFPDKAREVEKIFASSWRAQAEPGWQVQDDGGGWSRR